eukprot:3751245-Amphidinium_carterae.3
MTRAPRPCYAGLVWVTCARDTEKEDSKSVCEVMAMQLVIMWYAVCSACNVPWRVMSSVWKEQTRTPPTPLKMCDLPSI